MKREFGNLLAIADNHPKHVVTLDPLPAGTSYKGIREVPLGQFLLMENF